MIKRRYISVFLEQFVVNVEIFNNIVIIGNSFEKTRKQIRCNFKGYLGSVNSIVVRDPFLSY